MPSFDVVNRTDKAEVQNALQQARQQIAQRYDFKGSDTEIEQTDEGFVLRSTTEGRVEAALEVLKSRLHKRQVSLKNLDAGKIEPAAKMTFRQVVKLREGIEVEKARKIIKEVKAAKLKVQGQIMDDQVRITGKKRDDLQEVIVLLKGLDLGIDLQYINMRD
jgi:uncharacterized protein YajQ (UPF0234 family)